jgi:hypothetical protein
MSPGIGYMCGSSLLLVYSEEERKIYGYSYFPNLFPTLKKPKWGQQGQQGLFNCTSGFHLGVIWKISLKTFVSAYIHKSNWNKKSDIKSQTMAEESLKWHTLFSSWGCDLKYANTKYNHSDECHWSLVYCHDISSVTIKGFLTLCSSTEIPCHCLRYYKEHKAQNSLVEEVLPSKQNIPQ